MTRPPTSAGCERTLLVRVPMTLRKRSGRKLVLAVDGTAWAPARARIDTVLIKAIARAHRWKALLESGQFASVTDLAAAEKINPSYLCRVLRLTLLAPDIVEAIVDGRQPPTLQSETLLRPFPVEWQRQRQLIRIAT